MIESKIQIGDGEMVHTTEYGLVHKESDTRFGSDHSDYEMSKYPEEGKGHILPILTEKPFDYKVKFMVVPPVNEALAAQPVNIIPGTNRGAEGWRVMGRVSNTALQYNIGYHNAADRISGYDGDPIAAMVVERTSAMPFNPKGYEILLRDIDLSAIKKGWRYTLSMKIWVNSPGIDIDVCVCNIDSGGRLTDYAGIRNLKNGLNEVFIKFTAIADGVEGGTQSLYFGFVGDNKWDWSRLEVWDLKLSMGDYGKLPYTPNPFDVIPTVGELVDDFNSMLYEKSGDLKMMKKVTFVDGYKHCKIVGYPTPLALCDDYYSRTNIAAGQHTAAELTIKVDDPSLCEWATKRRPAPFVMPLGLDDVVTEQINDELLGYEKI